MTALLDLSFQQVEDLLENAIANELLKSRRTRDALTRKDHSHSRNRRRKSTKTNERGISRSISRSPSLSLQEKNSLRARVLRMKEAEERARTIEQAHRDDCTVLLLGVHPKAAEKDIYTFMSKHAGKVRDVQVITDARSGISKGVCYVEFYTPDSVVKALACNGMLLLSYPVRVQCSQAEKNRVAEATRLVQSQQQELPMRVYVGGLSVALSNITETHIRELFRPFGEIHTVEVARNPYNGKNIGYGYIFFKRTADAKLAISALHGFILCGQPIEVGFVATNNRNVNTN